MAREEELQGLGPDPNEPKIKTRRHKGGRFLKCFSDWIKEEPLEKWSLLHHTFRARYGIMTTNLAEVYNWVLKGTHFLPLVAIVEGILRGTMLYLRESCQAANAVVPNPHMTYSAKISAYIEEKSAKGSLHRVFPVGNQDLVYEVMLRDKGGLGTAPSEITMECQLWPEVNKYECTCNKPKYYHYACSHVLGACGKAMIPMTLVSDYFKKEAVFNTWCGELRGWRAVVDFTKAVHDSDHYWPPNPEQRVDTKGRRKSHHIRNDMDASEASDKHPFCLACGGNHLRKNCDAYPTNRLPDGTEVRRIPKRNSRQATQQGPSA